MKETTYTDLEKKLIEVLPLGGEHPMVASQIEKLTGISKRELRRMKLPLALKGVPIASSRQHPQGYYIISNNLEKRLYIKSLWSQVNQMNLLITALEKTEVE